MQQVPAYSEPCGSAPPWAWKDLPAEALCVQTPALHGELTSHLHWAGQGRCSSDKLCPGRCTFILGYLCPQNRQHTLASTSTWILHSTLHSLWTQEERRARITLPSHHLAVMLSTSPVHSQSAMKQPQNFSNHIIFILPAHQICTSSHTTRGCNSWVTSW